MRLINVVPIFPEQIDYMADEAKRLQRDSGIQEVALSLTLHPEGFPAIEKPIFYTEVFRKYKEALKGTGIRVGILLQSLIGHGWPGAPVSPERWQRTVNIHGRLSRWCPLDPGFQDYITKTIVMLAKEEPYSFLVDDDVRLIDGQGLECFCPLHMNQFNQGMGKEYSADELREIIRNAKPDDPLLKRFEHVRTESLFSFAKIIRRAIDSVHPEIRCGYCTPGSEFLINGAMAKLLAGGTKPFLRINNAMYMEGDAKWLPSSMGYTQMLRKINADIPEVLDESDTFPQSRYSKSAVSMHAHITASALNGLNAAKLWLTNLSWPDAATEKPYDEILGKHKKFYPALTRIMSGAKLQGPIVPIHDWKKFWTPVNPQSAFTLTNWQTQILGQIGIPGRFEFPSEPGLRMLAGSDSVAFFSDEELKQMLSGSLLLDGTAALEFCRRGFEKELGVHAEKKEFRFNYERNCSSGEQLTLMNDFQCPFLTPDSGKTEVLTELIAAPYRKSSDLTVVAPGTTLFRNALGGTVAVCAAHLKMPWYNYLSPGRKRLLIPLLDRLNGAPLPYVVLEEQNLYTLHALLPDHADLLAIFNLNFDPLSRIHIRVQKTIRSVQQLTPDGVWQEIEWTQDGATLRVSKTLNDYEFVILRIEEATTC